MSEAVKDISTIEDIKLFVDAFYAQIQVDELLGPVFASRIVNGEWGPHLEKMYRFWGSVLLSQRSYRGNPFARHLGLPINEVHFQQWLKLFHATIDQYFQGPVADDAKQRAANMAMMFQHKLAFLKANPNYNPLM